MFSLLLPLALLADSAAVNRIAVTASESLTVSISGTGPPIVVIPGLAGSAFAFRGLTPLLVAGGYRVVIVEPLGMGTSSRPEKADYTLETQANRIAAVLDTLGIEQAPVLGHSLGASLALRLALGRPDLVRLVMLVEGGAAEQAATPGFRRAMLLAPWVKMLGGRSLIRKQLRKGLTRASADPGWITEGVLDGYSTGVSQQLDQTLRGYLRMADARDRLPLTPRLSQLRMPVLLILGAAPHEGGPDAGEVERLAHGLPQFSMQQVAGAGHHVHEERPGELAGVILGFASPRLPGGM